MPHKGLVVLFAFLSTAGHAQWLNFPMPGTPSTRDGQPNLAAPVPRASDGKPDLTGVYFLRGKYRSPSVQCWIIAVTAPFASLTKSTPVPSMVKLVSERAISGIFPVPPVSTIKRPPSKETIATEGGAET